MKKYANYPVPHLLGQVSYQGEKKLEPDGDTIHLRNPVLLQDGKAIPPENGQFQVWVTGHAKPRLLPLQVDRYVLSEQLGLPLRDLRVLDPKASERERRERRAMGKQTRPSAPTRC